VQIRDHLDVDEERLADICQRHHVSELAVFGSVLRNDFGLESDVDLLYVFEPAARVGWREIYALERELSELLGRAVDLVSKRWLNPTIAEGVLADARTLYAA
jgi:predicted nucleotidyltransferase